MFEFTPTQGRYLAFIHDYTKTHGYPPTESEVSHAVKVSQPGVNQMVKRLEKKGLLQRESGKRRSLKVLLPEREIPEWTGR